MKLNLLAVVAVLAAAATVGTAAPNKEAAAPSSTQGGTAIAPLVAAQGVLVTGVQAGSPAAKAGIVRGDIVLEADGKAVNTPAELRTAITAKKSGDTLSLKVHHGDADKTVSVTLGTESGRTWLGIVTAGGGRGLAYGYGQGLGRGPLGNRGLGNPGFGNPGFGNPGFGMMAPAAGAYVAGVVAGGPAEKAGLAQGDVILSVDGTAIDAQHALGDLIAAKKVGDTVTLSVQSASQAQPRDVKVTLDKSPDKDAPRLGIQYTPVGPRIGRMMPGQGFGGRGLAVAGVFVADVAADSPAAKAGIKASDVITKMDGAAVTDPQQVVDAVAKHKPGDTVPVSVTRAADGTSADLSVVLGASPSDATKAYMGVSIGGAGNLQRRFIPRSGGTLPNASAPNAVAPEGSMPNGSMPNGSAAPDGSLSAPVAPTL